jgi:hypothetical protein
MPHRGSCSPTFGCTCGVYATSDCRPYGFRDSAFHRPRETFLVAGTAALWGRVIKHTRGWRAEHAYPKELWLVPNRGLVGQQAARKLAADVASKYGVPCELGDARAFFGSAYSPLNIRASPRAAAPGKSTWAAWM